MRINEIWKALNLTNNDLKRKHHPMRRKVHMRKYYNQIFKNLLDRTSLHFPRTLYVDTDSILTGGTRYDNTRIFRDQ